MNSFVSQLLSRGTAYLQRWHHRAVVWRESVAEHHALTARLAFEIATLAVTETSPLAVDPYKTAVHALYHDEAELVTGDTPSPAKRMLPRDVLTRWEAVAVNQLWAEYPSSLRQALQELVRQCRLTTTEAQIIRYADLLAAYSFALDQIDMGNQKMVDVRGAIEGNGYLGTMTWPWLTALRARWGLP